MRYKMKIFRDTDPPIAVTCYFSGCQTTLRFPTYPVYFFQILCDAHWKMLVEDDPKRCDTCAATDCVSPRHRGDTGMEYAPRIGGEMAPLVPGALFAVAMLLVWGRALGWF